MLRAGIIRKTFDADMILTLYCAFRVQLSEAFWILANMRVNMNDWYEFTTNLKITVKKN